MSSAPPAQVRRRYIDPLADQIADPFASEWIPSSLTKYDEVTRDEYLRSQHVSDAALHMMNLGSTPVARIRSFLDVLREVAVNRELRRRAHVTEDLLLKIEGGNDRLPQAFAARLRDRIRYRCAARRIEHDATGARVFFENGGSRQEFSPPLSAPKTGAIDKLPYHSVTRIYLQCRDRFWLREGLSGFADTDHPMEIWDATYGQKGPRGILLSFIQGTKARELAPASQTEQLRFGLRSVEEVYPGVAKAYLRGWMQGAFESGRRVAREIDATEVR